MVEIRDKFSLSGPTSNGRVSRRPQDEFGLLTRVVLTKVAQKLKELPKPRDTVALPKRQIFLQCSPLESNENGGKGISLYVSRD